MFGRKPETTGLWFNLFHPAFRWPNTKLALNIGAFFVTIWGVRNYGEVLLTTQ